MNTTQQIVQVIQKEMKAKGIRKGVMLAELGMGVNTLSQFYGGKQLSCLSLGAIADYLDVSVDYLLGRTENKESHKV